MHLSRRRTGRLIAEAWKEGSSSMVFEQITEILLRPDQSLRDVLERFNQTASATGSSGNGSDKRHSTPLSGKGAAGVDRRHMKTGSHG
jgi:hypothetical protein